jgi:hypothetical protein
MKSGHVGSIIGSTPGRDMGLKEGTLQHLIGTWRLVRWEERNTDGTIKYPLGDDAIGQIIYGADGCMSAQLMRRNQARFAQDDWRKATPAEKSEAWGNYFAYFGTYSVDTKASAVTHHVEGSWFPNLVGLDQQRYYRFEGDQLVLDADTAWGRVRIVWAKVEKSSAK